MDYLGCSRSRMPELAHELARQSSSFQRIAASQTSDVRAGIRRATVVDGDPPRVEAEGINFPGVWRHQARAKPVVVVPTLFICHCQSAVSDRCQVKDPCAWSAPSPHCWKAAFASHRQSGAHWQPTA
jgi:hypothetical protein